MPRPLRGRAGGGDAKPRRRSRLRKQSAQALLDRLEAVRRAFLYRMPFAPGGGLHSQPRLCIKPLLLVRFPSGGFASSTRRCRADLARLSLWIFRKWASVFAIGHFDGFPQIRSGRIEKAFHPLAPSPPIVILASGFGYWFWRHRELGAALPHRDVLALVTRSQLSIQP